jgi:hypothetical protein
VLCLHQKRGRGGGGGGSRKNQNKKEELDPMDPASYSEVPRYTCFILL